MAAAAIVSNPNPQKPAPTPLSRPNSLLTKVTTRLGSIFKDIKLDKDFELWAQAIGGEEVGNGAYGRVKLTPERKRVVKVQSPHRTTHPAVYHRIAAAEAALHESLNGTPHLPHFFEARSSNKRVGHVMEYAGDTLYRIYSDQTNPNRKIATLADVERIGKIHLEFLMSIHAKKIAHFDLKPSNATSTMVLDLGLATQVPPEGITGLRVSAWYRSPEITLNLRYGTPADIWSVACILFELMTGSVMFPIYDGKNSAEQIQADINRLHAHQDRLGPIDLNVLKQSPSASKLLETKEDGTVQLRRTTYPYKLRSLEMIIEQKMEPGVRRDQFIDLLRNMLAYDPSKRFDAARCLHHPFFSSKSSADCSLRLDLTQTSPLSIQIRTCEGHILHTIKLNGPNVNGCYHVPKSDEPYSVFFIDPSTQGIQGCSEFRVEGNSVVVINPVEFSSYALPSIDEVQVKEEPPKARRRLDAVQTQEPSMPQPDSLKTQFDE